MRAAGSCAPPGIEALAGVCSAWPPVLTVGLVRGLDLEGCCDLRVYLADLPAAITEAAWATRMTKSRPGARLRRLICPASATTATRKRPPPSHTPCCASPTK